MWEIYDYVDRRNFNAIATWTRGLQKVQKIKLRSKLDLLAKAGPELPPGLLLKTEVEYIFKLKVQGNPKLRPMLCRGPLKTKNEERGDEEDEKAFTILVGAKEISWKFEPVYADVDAGGRRVEVINDPKRRRCKHERVD